MARSGVMRRPSRSTQGLRCCLLAIAGALMLHASTGALGHSQSFACGRSSLQQSQSPRSQALSVLSRRGVAEEAAISNFEWGTEAPAADCDGTGGGVGDLLQGVMPAGGWDAGFLLSSFVYVVIPLFLVTLALVPIVDKYILGKEYEIDWSGKSGRLYQLLTAKDVLAVPDVEDDLKFYDGSYEDLKKQREKEGGVMGLMNNMFGAEDARRETQLQRAKEKEEAAKKAAEKGKASSPAPDAVEETKEPASGSSKAS